MDHGSVFGGSSRGPKYQLSEYTSIWKGITTSTNGLHRISMLQVPHGVYIRGEGFCGFHKHVQEFLLRGLHTIFYSMVWLQGPVLHRS